MTTNRLVEVLEECQDKLPNSTNIFDIFLPPEEIKECEDFRKMLVKRYSEYEIERALLLFLKSSLDPDLVFDSHWKAGPLCSELFPKATAKYINQIPKSVKKFAKVLNDIYFEAPVSYNPQNTVYLILGHQALRILRIVSGLCFENPELYTKLSEKWKRAVEKYQGSDYRWQKIEEASKLFGVEVDKEKMPFDSYSKFFGIPLDEGDSSYFSTLYADPEVHKITGTEMKTRSYEHDVYKHHPEILVFGWFKELRKNYPEIEKYLKGVSIDYTTEDICDILIYSEIAMDDESISSEKALDLFWENSDSIYEKMFHNNISETPIRLARTYISMFV